MKGQSSPSSIYPYVEHIWILIFLEQNSKNLDSVARVRERKEGSEDWDVKGAKNQTGRWPYIKTALLTTLSMLQSKPAFTGMKSEGIAMKPVN